MSTTTDPRPSDPELAHWAGVVGRLRWAGFLLDREMRLVWASPDLQRFLGSPPQDRLCYGVHIVDALGREPWSRIATSESGARLVADLGPLLDGGSGVGAKPIATSFDYLEPGGDPDLPLYRVNVLAMPLRDDAGALAGVLALGYTSVRPGLVALLARGDETMYERMAKLVEPSSREAAILFCDLQGSTELARTLPTAEYFRLIRRVWTEIDALVGRHEGLVGKHAGDGASAFFLVDDLGSASGAASAAVRTARAIHERTEDVSGGSPVMRVGIHWGGSLYIGQLVPGGRLDVTALGDAVNECARIQECAEPHQTLASKDLVERLSPDDSAALGLDPDKVRYRPLTDLAHGPEKALSAVGALPVTVV
jgi:class 3 adenylate cyclase